MSQSDEIKQYVKTVCEQIRWKKARSIVAEEIENHICDQRDAYVSQGEDEKTATEKQYYKWAMPFPSVWSSIKFTGQSLSGQ